MEANRGVSGFENYLDRIVPKKSEEAVIDEAPKVNCRWVYSNAGVAFQVHPGKELNTRIETVFAQMHKDFKSFSDEFAEGLSLDYDQAKAIQNQLASLRVSIKDKVARYQEKHSGLFGAMYLFFQKHIYGDINALSKEILDFDIQNLERLFNPTLQKFVKNPQGEMRALPLAPDALGVIMANLPAKAIGIFERVLKVPEESVKDSWLPKAREFGYVGIDPEAAKQHMQSLDAAINFLDKEAASPSTRKAFREYVVEGANVGKIDLENTLRNLAEHLSGNTSSIFAPTQWRENNGKVGYLLNSYGASEDNLTVLARYLLSVLKQFEMDSKIIKAAFPKVIHDYLVPTFRRAVYMGNMTNVELMLKLGASDTRILNAEFCDAQFVEGCYIPTQLTLYPVLHMAIERRNPQLLQMLINYGADMDADSSRRSYFTPLQFAISSDNLDAAAILLKAGAEPDALNALSGYDRASYGR